MNCRASYCFHAHRIHGNGPCERCGRDARDVHHRDGDWRNNAPQNLERLCDVDCHGGESDGYGSEHPQVSEVLRDMGSDERALVYL